MYTKRLNVNPVKNDRPAQDPVYTNTLTLMTH